MLQVVMVMDRCSPFWSAQVNSKLVAERRAYLDRIVERVRGQELSPSGRIYLMEMWRQRSERIRRATVWTSW